MTFHDPDLLRSFARRNYVAEPGSPEAELAAEEAAHEEWLRSGEPLDGLSAEDAQLLADAPLKVRQAALRERVSEKTIRRWIAAGQLEASPPPIRITREALDRRRVQASRPKPRAARPAKRRPRRKAAQTANAGWFKA